MSDCEYVERRERRGHKKKEKERKGKGFKRDTLVKLVRGAIRFRVSSRPQNSQSSILPLAEHAEKRKACYGRDIDTLFPRF